MIKSKKIRLIRIIVIAVLALWGIILAGFISPLRIKKYNLTFDNLPKEMDGYRIVQITDFHCKEFGDHEEDLIKLVAKAKPDVIFLTGDSLYLAEITSGNFEDISSVKINRKIMLRTLEIKVSVKDEEILEIADKDLEIPNIKYSIIHCLNLENTGKMFNFLSKQKKNCLQAEYALLNSYLDNLENKFNIKENLEENKN